MQGYLVSICFRREYAYRCCGYCRRKLITVCRFCPGGGEDYNYVVPLLISCYGKVFQMSVFGPTWDSWFGMSAREWERLSRHFDASHVHSILDRKLSGLPVSLGKTWFPPASSCCGTANEIRSLYAFTLPLFHEQKAVAEEIEELSFSLTQHTLKEIVVDLEEDTYVDEEREFELYDMSLTFTNGGADVTQIMSSNTLLEALLNLSQADDYNDTAITDTQLIKCLDQLQI